jgi:Na+/melibiose symporter-like transporter
MNDPSSDWKNEVNWLYVRQFFRAHLIMWVFGCVLTLLSTMGLLVGATRKFLGILALLIFAASLVGVVPIFGNATQENHEGPVYSFQVFLIFFGFLLSSGGYMWLLSTIGLHSIELW